MPRRLGSQDPDVIVQDGGFNLIRPSIHTVPGKERRRIPSKARIDFLGCRRRRRSRGRWCAPAAEGKTDSQEKSGDRQGFLHGMIVPDHSVQFKLAERQAPAESQRDSETKPGVARNELPRVARPDESQRQRRCGRGHASRDVDDHRIVDACSATSLRLDMSAAPPGVASYVLLCPPGYEGQVGNPGLCCEVPNGANLTVPSGIVSGVGFRRIGVAARRAGRSFSA